jgi:hypothetical protein
MTIDDELLLDIIKPNKLGEPEGNLIREIVGSSSIKYALEELVWFLRGFQCEIDGHKVSTSKDVTICPDIIITLLKEENKQIAIELENDIQWDFGHSLRQIKDYQYKFKDTRIIIPEEFIRYAPLYKNEGFRVYLWKAKRLWQCLRCGNETQKEGPVAPKCQSCNNASQTDFRLVGLRETQVEEFV